VVAGDGAERLLDREPAGASIFTATRLFLYARWSDSATHPVVAEGSSFALRRPGPFLAMTIPFTLAHAVMLAAVFAAVLHMPRQNGESFDEYWRRTNLPAGTGPAAKAPRPQWRVKMKRREAAADQIARSDQPITRSIIRSTDHAIIRFPQSVIRSACA
jgi:hypothetical protein